MKWFDFLEICKEKFPEFINDYILYLKHVRNRSEETIKSYLADLSLFLKFIRVTSSSEYSIKDISEVPIKDIELDTISNIKLMDIHSYITYLYEYRGLVPSSVSRHIFSIKSMFKYLSTTMNLIENNPAINLERPKVPKQKVKYLSEEECYLILDNVNEENKARDYLMILIFINCGLRLSELCNINLRDITSNKITITGKGNKQRYAYLNDICMNALKDYLEEREFRIISYKGENTINTEALFLSERRNRISPRAVQHVIRKLFKKVQLSNKGYTVHKLRHTAATLLYQNGTDIVIIQEILGHESIATTQIYTHTTQPLVENAIMNNVFNKKASE